MATTKTNLLEDVSSDMRDLCGRVLTLLGPTPVSIAYYTGELGENWGRVKLALETLARLGLAQSERTVVYGVLYARAYPGKFGKRACFPYRSPYN
jgi:hypothetical protein